MTPAKSEITEFLLQYSFNTFETQAAAAG